MPTYNTPSPIDLAINLQFGSIEVTAGDRADTVVTVSASNPTKASDRRGADATKIDFDGRRVTIIGPRPRISLIGPGPMDSVDVKVELPAGSRLTAEIAVGGLRSIGRLAATRIKSSFGPVDIESTGDLWLRVSHGNATVGTADGGIEITSDFGQIRVGAVTGDSILKSSHGAIVVGESGGDLDAKLSYGDLDITKALGSVSAKTAYGDIRLREISSGSIQVESGFGQVAIGIRQDVPAWLDLSSKYGHVRNDLAGDRAPDASEQTVAVRARTQGGDLNIHRARTE
jgi:Putative adhesin